MQKINTYYQKKKDRLQELAQNHYYRESEKKVKQYEENKKKFARTSTK